MKSLHKTLDIIDVVAQAGEIGIRDISTKTGFPPATIHRIASTLVKRRYLSQHPVTKRYALSFRFLELGTRVQEQFDLSAIARPHLQQLMNDTQESANLVIQDGDEVVYIDQVKSEKSMLKIFTRLGARVPLYNTGVGKMLLSQWGESDIDSYLDRTDRKPFTSNTLVKRDEIIKELKQNSRRGFSVDNEEMENGVRCVAALIFDHKGKVTAAVSISGAAMRITPNRIEYFGEKVKQCALAISRELGFVPME
ncbi:MAG TPA: IclR family transcriptional regulator [Desulfobacterales bacterium]|nr:IclR family transcriptional regulator [Desulfobacterales bacterium]